MNKAFYSERQTNFFDKMVVDVERLYERFPISEKVDPRPCHVESMQSLFHKIYRNSFIPLKYRRNIWSFCRRTNIDLTWLDEFRSYWSSVLRGRPLFAVHDFFFLKNLYRVKFQNSQIPYTDDPHVHLQAWQRPELLYMLFHQISKEAMFNQLEILSLLRKHAKKNLNSFLEFGCGTAPITTSFFEFFRPAEDVRIYISDIQTLPFHYAAFRFRKCANVSPVLLAPEDRFALSLDEKMDAICCITVFEHLNEPLETGRILHDSLNRGGLLFFDYAKTEAAGLDTHQGARERDNVLEFLDKNFDTLYGHITKDEGMNLTVARKR